MKKGQYGMVCLGAWLLMSEGSKLLKETTLNVTAALRVFGIVTGFLILADRVRSKPSTGFAVT